MVDRGDQSAQRSGGIPSLAYNGMQLNEILKPPISSGNIANFQVHNHWRLREAPLTGLCHGIDGAL